ncbi:6153d87d-ba3a-47df-b04b-a2fd6bef792e [Sclerotinia trifoliorum]|uniref:6153d87d-ba3a-47df-b04b-a2fd6bef792e n=1 Tax=Sclerotinia trifoliorum TaxID=28548 RepID=A0A8H2VQI2_9HELO|nr:6153d87d-ba3a-47df-b04b-a2fd6bef792e [Sclerotinia trifoliorum]
MYGRADLDQGSLAYRIVKKESRLFPIPKELSDEEAAPLMCAGATVFNVLDTYRAKPTDRVGVIGVGGLGHLAIQFASKMGCEVIAFSSTQSKESDALSFGASFYYDDTNFKVAKLGSSLDILIVTAPTLRNWGVYLPFLTPKAKIFALTIGPGQLALPNMPLLLNGITIQGSILAPTNVHKRMLEFAAAEGVKPKVQKLAMDLDGIVEAFRVLKNGKMRYRGVLVVPEEKRLM